MDALAYAVEQATVCVRATQARGTKRKRAEPRSVDPAKRPRVAG